MQNGNDFESQLWKALRMHGYDVPLSEDEIIAFEKAGKDCKIPEMPEGLLDPMKILERGIIEHTATKEIGLNTDGETLQNLAMAAREGKEIPEEVKKLMLKDRKDSEENSSK